MSAISLRGGALVLAEVLVVMDDKIRALAAAWSARSEGIAMLISAWFDAAIKHGVDSTLARVTQSNIVTAWHWREEDRVERDAAIARAKAAERERDEARAHTSTAAFMRIERERDAARARVEEQEAQFARLKTTLDRITAERDAARAENARLRTVVDAARATTLARWCNGLCAGHPSCDCGSVALRAALAALDAEEGGR